MSGARFTLDMLGPKARAQAIQLYNAQRKQIALPPEEPKVPRALQPMKGQKVRGPNKTELRLKAFLQAQYPDDDIEHEPLTLRLANSSRYTPDFVVWDMGRPTAYEVKGFMREAAAVRIKVAAKMMRGKMKFIIVYADKHSPTGWRMEEVLP